MTLQPCKVYDLESCLVEAWPDSEAGDWRAARSDARALEYGIGRRNTMLVPGSSPGKTSGIKKSSVSPGLKDAAKDRRAENQRSPQDGEPPEAPEAKHPHGWPEREVFVRQQFPRKMPSSNVTESGRQRWASPKRKLDHTHTSKPPKKSTCAGGVDASDTVRSNATTKARGNGGASRRSRTADGSRK